MSGKTVGFTGKAVERSSSYEINIPDNTAASLNLRKNNLVHLTLRNMQGNTAQASRKIEKSGNTHKFYIPKSTAKELDLTEGDLLDIQIKKD